MKVLKFGGTSMANADSIRKVADIVKSNALNRFVIVSAPGKREKSDVKVTDLLYNCYNVRKKCDNCDAAFALVEKRFHDIAEDLNLASDGWDLDARLKEIKDNIDGGASCDYVASRGEYLSAYIMAKFTGMPFVDAKDIVRFDLKGEFDENATFALCNKILDPKKGAVIPGFYGQMPDGAIKTFSRGGSDVTGAIIAGAMHAGVYENWTDVDGFMTCDPRIVENAKIIDMLTYRELRELSYMGANVLHPESIFPVRKSDIPIRIKNTFNPAAEGTQIVPTKKFLKNEFKREELPITGIAGKKDFLSVYVEKSMMNNQKGFARRLLSVLEKYDVSLEHMPSGIDTLSVVIDKTGVGEKQLSGMMEEIKLELNPDRMEVNDNLALIAVVGHGMNRKKGVANTVAGALFKADVNIRMIDQGSSEMNIIIAVEDYDYEKAIRALYNAFYGK